MSQRDDIDNLITEQKRRLHQLRLQQARFGYNTPPHVLMEIEDLEKEIVKLEQELAALSDRPKNELPDFKRKALTQRRAELIKEYEAASSQIGVTLDPVAITRLKRQVANLAAEIIDLEQQLGITPSLELAADPAPEDAKAPAGAAPGSATLYGQGNRWAVLVGANTYKDAFYGPLHACVQDVAATREQLIAGGFDPDRIRLLTDNTDEQPSRGDVLTALTAVAAATDPDDLLLFYYSGHGFAEDGESYLIGYDGRHLALKDTAIAVSRVKEIMQKAPARAKVLLLDACQSGAAIDHKGPRPMSAQFIDRVFAQAAGMAILSSCQQDELSYEWQERERSAFTHFLLEALKGAADRDAKGRVTIQDVNRHVTNGVRHWASLRNRVQTPTFQAEMSGDIELTQYTDKTSEVAAAANNL
jgi:hypothetical protein